MDHLEPALCPRFHHAIEFIGKRWSGAIVMTLMRRDRARFNGLLALIPGISDRLLSERLRELESEGVVERLVEDDRPVRVFYRLSERGRALEPALAELAKWAETHVDLEARVSQSA
jgi:DNA-binding HxlR family transcriptional regulator